MQTKPFCARPLVRIFMGTDEVPISAASLSPWKPETCIRAPSGESISCNWSREGWFMSSAAHPALQIGQKLFLIHEDEKEEFAIVLKAQDRDGRFFFVSSGAPRPLDTCKPDHVVTSSTAVPQS